ncbi:MAG TPA: type III pantothenate kinase, partial [Erysipelothrix sp.]|nr:type III pantothenate kinase [Erysipelothrix sp.]
MILTLDIGNSTMKIIAYTHQDDVIFERSSKTYKEPDELFYQEFFQDLKRLYNYQPDLIIVSSVVPKITKTIIQQLEATYQV